MAEVIFDKTTRIYPNSDRPAVDRLELAIPDGEFLVLVGPSGCGKSTSLRMLAGLETVNYGHIRIGSQDVTTLAPKDRDIAMVFQNYALYPHMTVGDNMGFALRIQGVEVLLQAILGGFAGVDDAADGFALSHCPPPAMQLAAARKRQSRSSWSG